MASTSFSRSTTGDSRSALTRFPFSFILPDISAARVAVAEMGRFYGLPTWGYAGHSDSCAMDEQAAADATFSVLVALLAGNNLGLLESASHAPRFLRALSARAAHGAVVIGAGLDPFATADPAHRGAAHRR